MELRACPDVALGNLTHVRLGDGTAIGYLIDAQNRCIGKTVNDTLVKAWLYQGQLTPVAELDGQGTVVSRFVYATGVNVPDYMVRQDSTYRRVRDHLGSVRLVVNVASGTVAQRLSYAEMGEAPPLQAPRQGSAVVHDSWRRSRWARLGRRAKSSERGT